MKKQDIERFIEEMEELGDEWEPEDVERVYGDKTIEEALDDRKTSVSLFFDIISKIIK